MSLLCRFAPPLRCFGVVFRHTLPTVIAQTETELCDGITLFRSFEEPPHSFGVVLRKSLTVVITPAQTILCPRVALIRCCSEPSRRLDIVMRHSLAFLVTATQVVLCFRMPRLGGPGKVLNCHPIVLLNAGSPIIVSSLLEYVFGVLKLRQSERVLNHVGQNAPRARFHFFKRTRRSWHQCKFVRFVHGYAMHLAHGILPRLLPSPHLDKINLFECVF